VEHKEVELYESIDWRSNLLVLCKDPRDKAPADVPWLATTEIRGNMLLEKQLSISKKYCPLTDSTLINRSCVQSSLEE
jgi:hypothetical protein